MAADTDQLNLAIDAPPSRGAGAPVLTIGHSTRPIEAFVALLRAHGVTTLADVRSMPWSRRHPQFGRDRLAHSLAEAGIGYVHLPALGGKREPRASSSNEAIRDPGFRAYADHMATPEFAGGIAELVRLADAPGARVAMMCAEADPAHCHRSFVADALALAGRAVGHIRSDAPPEPHVARPAARLADGVVRYPGPLKR